MKNDLYVAYHPVDGPVLHSLRESEEQVKARFDGWEYRPWKYMEEEGYVELVCDECGETERVKAGEERRVDGKLLICDWKTGKCRNARVTDEHVDQMAVYTLYAVYNWGYTPESTTTRLIYLRDNLAFNHDFLPEQLREAELRIKESCQEIQSCLRDPEKNIAHMDDFPMTEERWWCKRCGFYEACYSSREIEE